MTAPGDGTDTQARTPETTDRLMVGACGAIWLVFLVVSAIAVVALTNLGRGHRAAEDGGSPWLLYTVIAVSAVTIVGAIPLLLKARRAALESKAGEADSAHAAPAITARAGEPVPEAATEKMRVFGTSVDPSARRHAAAHRAAPENAGVLERLWLRGTTSLLGAMGLAMVGVSTATYLLAAGSDTGAWVALGVAGVITVAMPAVLVFFTRQLAEAVPAE